MSIQGQVINFTLCNCNSIHIADNVLPYNNDFTGKFQLCPATVINIGGGY